MQPDVASLAHGDEVRRIVIGLFQIPVMNNEPLSGPASYAGIAVSVADALAQRSIPTNGVGEIGSSTAPVVVVGTAARTFHECEQLVPVWPSENLPLVEFGATCPGAALGVFLAEEFSATSQAELLPLGGATVLEHWVGCPRFPGSSAKGSAAPFYIGPSPRGIAGLRTENLSPDSGWLFRKSDSASFTQNRHSHHSIFSSNSLEIKGMWVP